MARPRKQRGFRSITVDDLNYSWRLNQLSGLVEINIADSYNQRLEVDFGWYDRWLYLGCAERPPDYEPQVITSGFVEQAIRSGLQQGWAPHAKGGTFRIRYRNECFMPAARHQQLRNRIPEILQSLCPIENLMSSPLASPDPWNTIAEGYTIDTVPLFSRYAEDAIRLAELPPDATVLDVATGPGTLALIAARRARQVTGIDFAEGMIAMLRRRAAEQNIHNVEAITGNGQQLPFGDATFDAGFSMFGLMFFPDRAAGFAELYRTLKPGAHAVVSSWAPMEHVPLMATLFDATRSILPDFPLGGGNAPLSNADEFSREMLAAGFGPVAIHPVSHFLEIPSVRSFCESRSDSSAPMALLYKTLGEERWREFQTELIERMEEKFGTGPMSVEWPALLGVGVR